ncbi:MAG: transporter [Ignavibacteriae bacterium]|nr:transporter [Ignavibacteriota bacterium]MCB9244085.1 transporter [Ignavibacteriales bacterium]
MRKLILSISLILLLHISIFAQTNNPGVISPDRPDQTESPDILTPGYVQIETGITYERYSYSSVNYEHTRNTFNIPGMLRIGVFPNMELRITPEFQSVTDKYSYTFQGDQSKTTQGLIPLVLGTKIKIVDEAEDMPAMAFLFHVDLPGAASEEFQNKNPTPEIRLALSKQLQDNLSIGFNLGAFFDMDHRETAGIYTVSLAMDLTKRINGFIELYGNFEQQTSLFVDGGFSYLLMKNLMVDISGGTGLTVDSPNFFIGGGLSVRLPR